MGKTTRQLISEIVLRSVAETLPQTSPADVDSLAQGLITLIEDVVVGVRPEGKIVSDSYRTFVIWNSILDRIEVEIPVLVGKIEVTGTITRTQRRAFNDTTTPDRYHA